MKPRNADTFNKVCNLKTDNHETKTHWIIINGKTVTIKAQKSGEESTQTIDVPRGVFNRLIDWYNKDQA